MVNVVPDDVELLSERALHWLVGNLDFLDPALSTDLPPTPRLKAMLQLGLLCRYWERLRPTDENFRPVAALARKIWDWPGLAEEFSHTGRRWAAPLALIYATLPPAGTAGGQPAAVIARLAAGGYLAPGAKSPYLRLETRHFADQAGVAHSMESYPRLYAASLLAGRTAALPMDDLDACNIAHIIFYLYGFGFREPGLPGDGEATAHRISRELTEHYARHNEWDYVAKYLLAQFCCGGDPARTPDGAAGIQCLLRAQGPDGEIPAPSAGQRLGSGATRTERFRKAYQVTLMTALSSLIIGTAPAREKAD